VRWGLPEPIRVGEYELLNVEGMAIYVQRAIKGFANARIDAVTGGIGTKLIFLGCPGNK